MSAGTNGAPRSDLLARVSSRLVTYVRDPSPSFLVLPPGLDLFLTLSSPFSQPLRSFSFRFSDLVDRLLRGIYIQGIHDHFQCPPLFFSGLESLLSQGDT
jgi:hypothetical protein